MNINQISLIICYLLPVVLHAQNAEVKQSEQQEEYSYAYVYTAKIEQGEGKALGEYVKLAKEKGTKEIISFLSCGDPCSPEHREILRLGELAYAYPGFSVRVQSVLREARSKGELTKIGSSSKAVSKFTQNEHVVRLKWDIPAKKEEAIGLSCEIGGTVITNNRCWPSLQNNEWPRITKVTRPDRNGCIIQAYEYLSGDIGETLLKETQKQKSQEKEIIGQDSEEILLRGEVLQTESEVNNIDLLRTIGDQVSFGASLEGMSYDYDTGWRPNGSPIKIRIKFGAGADISSKVNGSFNLDTSEKKLCIGSGSGYIDMDYGAEFTVKGSIDVWIIDPIEFGIPYIPQFELRIDKRCNFSSYLLDTEYACSGKTGRNNILEVDLTNLVLPVPGIGGGVGADGALSGTVRMSASSIKISDGNQYTSERQCRSIDVCTGYHETATYNDSCRADVGVILYPTMYVKILIYRWDMPIIDIPWDIYEGTIDLPFSTSRLDYDFDLRETWYRDSDGDGYGDSEDTRQACDQPSGYVPNPDDCDDNCSSCHPGGTEVCDDKDNDCDGKIDEGSIGPSWYRDSDGDGYGDSEDTKQACYQPPGCVPNPGDCDDNDATINPNAQEICDQKDNDCDGEIDEGDVCKLWYRDADDDGYGDPAVSQESDEQPDGYVGNANDCNDNDATINPDAEEICDDIDNNCDGVVDEGGVCGAWYRDADGDGYGDPGDSKQSESQPGGYVRNARDCNDNDINISPDAKEICDEIDNNCDGMIDEGGVCGIWYRDGDDDGYGDPEASLESDDQPDGYVGNAGDCDDDCESCHPGASEQCDGEDNDCDGEIDEDGVCDGDIGGGEETGDGDAIEDEDDTGENEETEGDKETEETNQNSGVNENQNDGAGDVPACGFGAPVMVVMTFMGMLGLGLITRKHRR